MSTDPNAPRDPAQGASDDARAAGPEAPGGPGHGGPGGPGPGGPGGQPSEAELRAAYEAELARITSTDMMLQAAVSLLNVGSYRLMPAPAGGAEAGAPAGAGRDLEQARDAIDGVRALLEILERRVPSELRPLRDALSQLQMAYAREAQAAGGAPPSGGGPGPGGGEPGQGGGQEPSGGGSGGAAGGQGQGPGKEGPPGPGPAESSGRLWVPGR